jgi:hypothetical protein
MTADDQALAAKLAGLSRFADNVNAATAATGIAVPLGGCPPHGTERCGHCGHLPVVRIWSDRTHSLWDEHPNELASRVDAPDGVDQEVPLSDVRAGLGPLVIIWHAEDACPPGCTLRKAQHVRP